MSLVLDSVRALRLASLVLYRESNSFATTRLRSVGGRFTNQFHRKFSAFLVKGDSDSSGGWVLFIAFF